MSNDSDLIFFTGFEGCTNTTDIRGLSTEFSTSFGPNIRTDGFLGSKCMRIYRSYTENIPLSPLTNTLPDVLYFGFHMIQNRYGNNNRLCHIQASGVTVQFMINETRGLLYYDINNSRQTTVNIHSVENNTWFHADGYLNRLTGEVKMKINGITFIDDSDRNLGNNSFHTFGFRGNGSVYYGDRTSLDNIWIHKSKSLGQARAKITYPEMNGYYNKSNQNIHTNDRSEEIHQKLQGRDGDNHYLYTSFPDTKFTVKHEEIPLNFNSVAYTIQSMCKRNTGGDLLHMKHLNRFNNVDYENSESVEIPLNYAHSYLYRSNYDLAPDGTELTTEKINSIEYGASIVEETI